MKKIPGLDALQLAMKNDHRAWQPSPKYPQSAAARFAAGGYFTVAHKPKFTVNRTEAVYTIGSCFARNVEHTLHRKGFCVTTQNFRLPIEYYTKNTVSTAAAHRGVLNKYNVHSMATEISRALGNMAELPNQGFIQVGDGLWFDPQASNIEPASLEKISEVRKFISEANQTIRDASIVFITLGLTETWYDAESGLSLNNPPSPQFIRRMPGRFYFKNTTAEEATSLLRSAIIEIKETLSPKRMKFIVTVSPVPMGTTYTGWDAVVANTYSKSTLRCAAQCVADEFDDVDYFPSFEMVSSSPRALAFAEDGAHVQNDMVRHVIETFANLYIEDN